MRRGWAIGLAVLIAAAISTVVLAQGSKETGRIGPESKIQPNGRKLVPAGKRTVVGNHPGGGALTRNGRFYWTLSAGRGRNDIRIVRTGSALRCRRATKPRRPRSGSRRARKRYRTQVRRYRARVRRSRRCQKKRKRQIGKVVQTIPMPGLNGGMVMSPDGRTAYVSGTPDSPHDDQRAPADVPGKEGDVIHVFNVNQRRGTATRAGVIEVPAPSGTPAPQAFPPDPVADPISWPRDLAISRDGKTILAALNLADRAAIVDTQSKKVRYVEVGSYPYGAAITNDGKRGLVSNEADGTVSVIDLDSAKQIKEITVGPHLSHPEGIAMDPKADRAYVTVTHQDLIAVVNTRSLEVERTLSVGRPEGIGTAPVDVSVTRDGCFLLSANSGEDALAVFALPDARGRTCPNPKAKKRRRKTRRRSRAALADSILQHEGRRGVDSAESAEEEQAEIYGEEPEERAEAAKRRRPARRRSPAFALVGRIPVGSYPVDVEATPSRGQIAWIAAKGVGVGPNPNGPNPNSPRDSDDQINSFQYLPSIVTGQSGLLKFPTDAGLRKFTPRVSKQVRPVNGQAPPPGTPITAPGPDQKIKHVFYIVRENRTYDQVLGDDPRGDGDPSLTLFPERITPNAHALAKRFPLLDHVYANSEASIDGHFWTSAASVSDYVVKNWHQNYAGRRPYDFGVYSVTWPSQGFLFDRAEEQGISYFNYGEAIAGTVPLADKDRNAEESALVARKLAKSDLGQNGCFPNDASSGGIDVVASAGPGPDVEVYDSSTPSGAPPLSESRFDCFRARFTTQVLSDSVPAFNYLTFSNDHTAGTTPGRRTPNAMVAENDYALGQVVDLISHSEIWDSSLILVIEDDSQDGADHVDAHRIPAFAISPYAKRGAVVRTRYDFLSFIKTLELTVGMKPLNLFDSLAVPMYDVFTPNRGNPEPYTALPPNVSLTQRNTAASPNAAFSRGLPLDYTDKTPQRYLDRILWQYVHGKDSEPPPPGPNASGLDEEAWKQAGKEEPEGD
ncbi:MAG: alkaline phosphatase family protein [Thermoleophilaceae bacterium]